MKKEAIIILFLISITLATAQPSLELNKQTLQPGETLLGKITTSGEFAEKIIYSQIQFYEGKKQVSFDYDFAFYDNTYFLYAYLTRQGNFTLKIDNIIYRENQELKSANLEQAIEIKEQFIDENKTQTQILLIKPGFIFSSEIPEINLENKGNTDLEVSYLDQTVTLLPLQTQQISYSPENAFSYLAISSYEEFNIPIIYFPFENPPEQIEQKIESNLKASPTKLQLKLNAKKQQQETIQLINFGQSNIIDITILSDLEILTIPEITQIPAKSIYNLTLDFYSEQQGVFNSNLTILFSENDSQDSIIIPLEIYAFPEEQDLENIEQQDQTCAELSGKVCNSNEVCSVSLKLTFGGEYCCLGTCEKPEEEGGSWGWLWGLIIILALGGGGYFIYKKVKKTKPIQPGEKLKQTSKLYERRVKGRLSGV